MVVGPNEDELIEESGLYFEPLSVLIRSKT